MNTEPRLYGLQHGHPARHGLVATLMEHCPEFRSNPALLAGAHDGDGRRAR